MTKHFTLSELIRSQTATRLGIANIPGPTEIANLNRLAELLELCRATIAMPITIDSGYRSQALNLAVGGTINSQHLMGCAADIRVDGLPAHQLYKRLAKSAIPYDQLILEFDDWVHVSVAVVGMPPRRELLVKDHLGTRQVVPDAIA